MIIEYFLKSVCFQKCFTHRLLAVSNLKISSYKLSLRNMDTKPPNILVYTGYSCSTLFEKVYNNLTKCLHDDRYTIYHLLESEIKVQTWMTSSVLLIVSSERLKDDIAEFFEIYLKKFGNILLICSNFDNSFIGSKCLQISDNETLIPLSFEGVGHKMLYRGRYSYDTCGTALYSDTSERPVIHKLICNKNILIFSEIYLDQEPTLPTLLSSYNSDDHLSLLKCILSEEFGLEIKSNHFVPQLTSGNYISKNEFEKELVKTIEIPLFQEVKMNFFDNIIKLPIYFFKNSPCLLTFNVDMYYSKLDSNVYGQQFVHFSVVTSTMDVAEQLSEYEGIVVIADYQISGKGRRSNKWISPKGSAMFTLHFTVNLNSHLGKKLSLLQHISALAVVHGIRNQPLYKDLRLRIKWPNDIYYDGAKLGGLLVTSVIQNDIAHVYIGWGINVENSHPTTCLNDAINRYNSEHSSNLPNLSVEEVVAYTLSQMEYFVKILIKNGPEKIFTSYYSYWIHTDQKVFLKNLNKQGTVIGLDEYGFLKVKTDKDEIITLQPDGNRFDIMKNLIYST